MQRDATTPLNREADEASLDPQDWEELRSLGHRMLDDMLDYLSTIRDKPAWQSVPEGVKNHLKQPLPVESQDAAVVYQEFVQNVLP